MVFQCFSQKYIETNDKMIAQIEISMKINKNKAKLNCGDLAATWPRPRGEMAATWPLPGRYLARPWPRPGCELATWRLCFLSLAGLGSQMGHRAQNEVRVWEMYGKCMGNAWETHGRAGLA